MQTQDKAKHDIKKICIDCPLCGANDNVFHCKGREHEYNTTTDDIFTFVKCRGCGLVYLNPRPDISEFPTIYPPDYYAYKYTKKEGGQDKKGLVFALKRKVWAGRLANALRYFSESPKIKVLDVGCGDGRALDFFRYIRPDAETYGVEAGAEAIKCASERGHIIFKGFFEEADVPDNYFDIVFASHVIEHVATPVSFAEKVFRILKPGGIFMAETPNINSIGAIIFKNGHWGGYHIPRHWQLFNDSNIRKLSDMTGFEFKKKVFNTSPHFWIWTFHSILKNGLGFVRTAEILFPPVKIFENNLRSLCLLSIFTMLDLAVKFIFGKTANMQVIMRKPGK